MEFASAIVAKLAERSRRFEELTAEVSRPEAAAAGRRYIELLRERGSLERSAELFEKLSSLRRRRAEAEALLADASTDAELRELASEDLEALDEEESALDHEIKAELVQDAELERRKIVVEIRAGTGGDEASLFAADLYRMYQRYVEAKRWRSELLDASRTEVGGFKDVSFAVEGEGCWRLFRFESGGHRVQRVPATESQGRIHTSAATVAVLPEPEEVEIELEPDDLRIDTMRAGGAGGQHVNKVESAVRITHLPTNTVVVCQDEKSQHKNKARALRILRVRLFERERERIAEERASARKLQVGSGDRSQRIRTYNFPQNRVSDHRLGQNFSLEQVIFGRLDPILEALEERDREERIRAL